MTYNISKWLNKRYPQNNIIKKPFLGSLMLCVFCIVFILLYKPLNTHAGKSLNYIHTMILYCASMAFPVVVLSLLIKKIDYFSKIEDWTILKEFVSIVIIFLGIGTTVYFMGFLLEDADGRWNMNTYLDSCFNSLLVSFIPFAYFSIRNYRLYISKNLSYSYNNDVDNQKEIYQERISISSKLKNEGISFFPNQFVYAVSDGNYVNFYLKENERTRKETIRNSISNVEEQLSGIPFIIRTHRAFIINIKMVSNKEGNSLGYKLRMENTDYKIPVSRKRTKVFDKKLSEFE